MSQPEFQFYKSIIHALTDKDDSSARALENDEICLIINILLESYSDAFYKPQIITCQPLTSWIDNQIGNPDLASH